ncbi:MAG: OmpA family protein [Myxococcota bacterium]
MKATLTVLLAALTMAACVKKSTHEALQADYAELQEAQEACTQKSADLEEALAAEQGKVRDLEQRISAMDEQLEETRGEKARLLKDRAKLKASAAELEEALAELEKRKAAAEERAGAYRDLLARFQKMIEAGKLRVRIIDGRMVVQLATDILFPSGSARLSRDGRGAIEEVTDVLVSIPERRYEIAGHTDDVPISGGRYDSNWELAFGRANSVLQTMIDVDMPPERVHASSYGEYRPVASNETREGRAQNRRIEIVLVPDLSALPGAEALEEIGS